MDLLTDPLNLAALSILALIFFGCLHLLRYALTQWRPPSNGTDTTRTVGHSQRTVDSDLIQRRARRSQSSLQSTTRPPRRRR